MGSCHAGAKAAHARTELAIIGLGAWGLCVLERAVSRARKTGALVRVHVIEPETLGGGVYRRSQPDYLVLNNACNQLSLYAAPDEDVEPRYAVGLYEWAVGRGYRWVGYDCRIAPEGRAIEPTDYLPRRLMGEYLVWFYDTLVADAPPNLEVVRHYAAAADITAQLGGREAVLLDNGETVIADHVVLASGHTFNEEPLATAGSLRYLRPYPVGYLEESIEAGASVAIAGMGLVAFDVLTALTVGRGGTFAEVGDRMRYTASGREPVIYMYSRSGVPYCAKSAHGIDPYGDYQPVVCTPEQFEALIRPSGSRVRRQVDFRSELLPLLFAEMQVRYHTHAALLRGGAVESEATRERLRSGWVDGRFDAVVRELESLDGQFQPADHIFAGLGRHFQSDRDYESQVYEMIGSDLDQALAEGSPVKAAQEVIRILRDQLRTVIEFGGLSLESYVDFQSNVRGRINRIEAGPPPLRSAQLLALMDAGVVRIPFGPNPEVSLSADGCASLRSTQLAQPFAARVDVLISGHLELPSLVRSASPLLNRLYAKGRLTQFDYGDSAVGSVAINESSHPYDAEEGSRGNSRFSACSPRECATSPTICLRPAAACAPSSTRRPASRASSAELDHRTAPAGGAPPAQSLPAQSPAVQSPPAHSPPEGRRPAQAVALVRAWSMSSIRSPMYSRPMESRMVSGGMPATTSSSLVSWRWVVDAGWLTSDFASPRLTSRLNRVDGVVRGRPARLIIATCHAEGHDRGHPTAEVAPDEVVMGVIGEAREGHPLDARVGVEVLGDGLGVAHVPFEAHGH